MWREQVNAPIKVCGARDMKGLYKKKKIRSGAIKNFTGIVDPYEPSLNPELECRTDRESVVECVKKVFEKIANERYIERPVAELFLKDKGSVRWPNR